jgi:hypothetical protein
VPASNLETFASVIASMTLSVTLLLATHAPFRRGAIVPVDSNRGEPHADLSLSDHREVVHSSIDASEAEVWRLSALKFSL